MWTLSAPVRSTIAGMLASIVGLAAYNYTTRPTTQTVQGIDNTTLMVISGVVAIWLWVNR